MALLSWHNKIHYLIKTWLVWLTLGLFALWLSPDFGINELREALLDATAVLVIAKLLDNRITINDRRSQG